MSTGSVRYTSPKRLPRSRGIGSCGGRRLIRHERPDLAGLLAGCAQVPAQRAAHRGEQHVVHGRALGMRGRLHQRQVQLAGPRHPPAHAQLAAQRGGGVGSCEQQLRERLRVGGRLLGELARMAGMPQHLHALMRHLGGDPSARSDRGCRGPRHRRHGRPHRAEHRCAHSLPLPLSAVCAGCVGGRESVCIRGGVRQRQHHLSQRDPVGDAVVHAHHQRVALARAPLEQVHLPQRL